MLDPSVSELVGAGGCGDPAEGDETLDKENWCTKVYDITVAERSPRSRLRQLLLGRDIIRCGRGMDRLESLYAIGEYEYTGPALIQNMEWKPVG